MTWGGLKRGTSEARSKVWDWWGGSIQTQGIGVSIRAQRGHARSALYWRVDIYLTQAFFDCSYRPRSGMVKGWWVFFFLRRLTFDPTTLTYLFFLPALSLVRSYCWSGGGGGFGLGIWLPTGPNKAMKVISLCSPFPRASHTPWARSGSEGIFSILSSPDSTQSFITYSVHREWVKWVNKRHWATEKCTMKSYTSHPHHALWQRAQCQGNLCCFLCHTPTTCERAFLKDMS